ncbi:MAG: F0F1 ATP synthase subunit B [Floccifex sp.]
MINFNIDNYLRISVTDVVLVLISTCLIILIAKHFFWDKLLAFIQKRQDLIQENIDSSEKIKKEAMNQKEAYDAKLKDVGNQAHSILESAKQRALQEKNEIIDQAHHEADHIKRKAKEEIERDKLNAQKEMREVISDVAIEAAKKLVKKEMDEEIQKQYVQDFIDQAGEKEW